MSIVAFPAGSVGNAYNFCQALTGKPKSIRQSSLPVGLTATLVGRNLCVKGTPTGEGLQSVYVGVASCATCDILEITGTIQVGADPGCVCIPPTITNNAHVAGFSYTAGDAVAISVPITGSAPFEFAPGFSLPDCLVAEIVGHAVIITGVAKTTGIAAVSIKNSCSCDQADIYVPIRVASGSCVVNWKISTPVFYTGVDSFQTYTATGIPKGCTLKLGVYDGATPFLLPSGQHAVATLTPTAATATFGQNWPASFIGAGLNVRPLLAQDTCMTCIIQPLQADFFVLANTCPITVDVTNQTITTVGVSRTTTITAGVGSGCTQAQVVLTGTLNGQPFSNTSVAALPFNFVDTAVSLAGDVLDATIAVIGLGSCAKTVACGSPIKLITRVPDTCAFTFLVTNTTINTAGQSHVLTVVGPVGATFNLDIVGTINGAPQNVHPPVTIPAGGTYTFTTAPSVAGDTADFTFGITPTGASARRTVCGGPFRVRTNVPSGVVCGGALTATAGGCTGAGATPSPSPSPPPSPAPSPSPSGACVSMGACYMTAGNPQVQFTFPGVAQGETVVAQLSTDGGTTWSFAFNIYAFSVPLTNTEGATGGTCPIFTLSTDGTVNYLSDANRKRRFVRNGTVLPRCA